MDKIYIVIDTDELYAVQTLTKKEVYGVVQNNLESGNIKKCDNHDNTYLSYIILLKEAYSFNRKCKLNQIKIFLDKDEVIKYNTDKMMNAYHANEKIKNEDKGEK